MKVTVHWDLDEATAELQEDGDIEFAGDEDTIEFLKTYTCAAPDGDPVDYNDGEVWLEGVVDQLGGQLMWAEVAT